MTDIATRLGVSKAALYRYVSNKEELLYECHKTATKFGDDAIAAAKASSGNGLQKLEAAIRALVTGYFDPVHGGAVIVDLDFLNSEQREHIVRERDRFTRALVRIVKEGVEDGSIAPTDPEFAVFTLMGAFTWMTRWYSPGGKWKVADLADMLLKLFVLGLRPR
jgi:TetR/AcrR family transcriptional regulator